VHVRRQVKLVGNKQMFGLPKGRKVRDVPLPDAVLEAINAHMTAYPPIEVTLPWDRTDGKPTTFSILLYSREKKALARNYINTFIWKPALKRAGVPVTRENGSHALRHCYASTALHEGESIKALSEYLGHADPGFTLRTYTHLVEDSAERTKRAVDAVFGHRTPEPEPMHNRTTKSPWMTWSPTMTTTMPEHAYSALLADVTSRGAIVNG
jgi:integrase